MEESAEELFVEQPAGTGVDSLMITTVPARVPAQKRVLPRADLLTADGPGDSGRGLLA